MAAKTDAVTGSIPGGAHRREGLEDLVERAGRLAVERIVGPEKEAEPVVDEGRKRARLKKRRLFGK
jgi:hypothetical protein